MKDVGYCVSIIFAKRKYIKYIFINVIKIIENKTSSSFILMLQASIYARTTGTAILSARGMGIASEQMEVGSWF